MAQSGSAEQASLKILHEFASTHWIQPEVVSPQVSAPGVPMSQKSVVVGGGQPREAPSHVW